MKLGTETGSLVNHLLAAGTLGQPTPEVGMGATLLSWTDRNPATITKVFAIGKALAVQVKQDDFKVVSGSMQDGSAEYEFSPNPTGYAWTFKFDGSRWVQVVLNKSTGRWKKVSGGDSLRIGDRAKYYDPHF